jgi:hypothetical protein
LKTLINQKIDNGPPIGRYAALRDNQPDERKNGVESTGRSTKGRRPNPIRVRDRITRALRQSAASFVAG